MCNCRQGTFLSAMPMTFAVCWCWAIGGQAASPAVVLERQQQERENLARFINGRTWPATQAAFIRAIAAHGHAEDVQVILSGSVPPLEEHANFETTRVVFEILRSDGTITPPPPWLISLWYSDRLSTIRRSFNLAWNETVCSLRAHRPISYSQIDALRSAIATWRSLAESEGNELPWLTRRRAFEFFSQMDALVTQIEDPHQRFRVETFLAAGGFSYEGGNVGGLAEHVLLHDLFVKPGSEAHKFLAELGRELLSLVEDAQDEHWQLEKDKREKTFELAKSKYEFAKLLRYRSESNFTPTTTYRRHAYTIPQRTKTYRTYYRYSVPTTRTCTYTLIR